MLLAGLPWEGPGPCQAWPGGTGSLVGCRTRLTAPPTAGPQPPLLPLPASARADNLAQAPLQAPPPGPQGPLEHPPSTLRGHALHPQPCYTSTLGHTSHSASPSTS